MPKSDSGEYSGIVVLFGNPSPQYQVEQPGGVRVSVPVARAVEMGVPGAVPLEKSVTRVNLWDGVEDPEFVERSLSTDNDRMLTMIARSLGSEHRRYAVAVNELEQIVAVHTGGASPDWVASSDPNLTKALAKHFDCPATDFEEVEGAEVGGPTALLTNAGRDGLHAQHLGTAAQPASFNYMALTANATAPAAGDTTLTAEIATAGGGLIRAQATYAHTLGTNTSTLTKTFTANGTDVLPVTVAKIGILNAGTAGTLGYETLLNATATLSASGDSLTVTETVTAG